MVAKLKAQPVVRKRRALAHLPAKKKKKVVGKDTSTRRHRADMVRSLEKSKEQGLSLGDELENEGSEEEVEEGSEESFSDEDENGSDVEAGSFFSTLKAESQDRDTNPDENFNEEERSVQGLLYADRDEEMEALDKEYKELQAQEVDMLHNLKGRSDEEVLKGRAVRSQKALWDKALEVRILLQKPFSNANQLPMGDSKQQMFESNKEVENVFEKLIASSTKTLSFLHQTSKALLNQNDSMDKDFDDDSATQENGKEFMMESSDDLDTIWEQISSSYSRFVPFRNSTVDRWQRKTQLSSGAAASKSKLRAFNQSVSQQIETQMRDFSRMLQRMCLKRSSVEIIGMPLTKPQAHTSPDDSRTDLQEGSKGLSGDPELIDDTEFYQELLREFLESSDPSLLGLQKSWPEVKYKIGYVMLQKSIRGNRGVVWVMNH